MGEYIQKSDFKRSVQIIHVEDLWHNLYLCMLDLNIFYSSQFGHRNTTSGQQLYQPHMTVHLQSENGVLGLQDRN